MTEGAGSNLHNNENPFIRYWIHNITLVIYQDHCIVVLIYILIKSWYHIKLDVYRQRAKKTFGIFDILLNR